MASPAGIFSVPFEKLDESNRDSLPRKRRKSLPDARYWAREASVSSISDTERPQRSSRRFSLGDFRFPSLKKVAAKLTPLPNTRKRRNSHTGTRPTVEIDAENAPKSPWDVALDSANLRGTNYTAAKQFAESTEEPVVKAAKFIQTIWRGHRMRKPKSDSLYTIRFNNLSITGLEQFSKHFSKPYLIITVRNKWTSQIIYYHRLPIVRHTLVLEEPWVLPGLDDACIFVFTLLNSRRFNADLFVCQSVVPFEHIRHAVVSREKHDFNVAAQSSVKYKQIWPTSLEKSNTHTTKFAILQESNNTGWPYSMPRKGHRPGNQAIKVTFIADVYTPEQTLIDWFWIAVPKTDASFLNMLDMKEEENGSGISENTNTTPNSSLRGRKTNRSLGILSIMKNSTHHVHRRVSKLLEKPSAPSAGQPVGVRKSSIVPSSLVDARYGGATTKYLNSGAQRNKHNSFVQISQANPIQQENRTVSGIQIVQEADITTEENAWQWRKVFGCYMLNQLNIYARYGALHPLCSLLIAKENEFVVIKPGLPSNKLSEYPPISCLPQVIDRPASPRTYKAECDARSLILAKKNGTVALLVATTAEKRNLWMIKISREIHKVHTRVSGQCPVCDGDQCPAKPAEKS